VDWSQRDGVLRGAIVQKPPYFGGPIQVAIREVNGRRTVRPVVVDTASRTEFTVQVDSEVQEVTLDPEFRVLHWTPEYRGEASLLAPYWKGFTHSGTNHDGALRLVDSAIAQLPARDTVGARFLLNELTARLLSGDAKTREEAKLRLQRGLMSASRRTERLGWNYYLLGYIASQLKDQATLQLAIQGAEAADAVMGSWSGWGAATRRLDKSP
jgi:hypothetical protein